MTTIGLRTYVSRTKRVLMPAGLAVILLLGLSTSARADTFSFNFNTLADGANAASIQTYMQGVINAAYPNKGYGVTVSAYAMAEKNYNADGHVVGACVPAPCSSGDQVYSATLAGSVSGTTNSGTNQSGTPALDTFIRNAGGPAFTFTFTGGILIDTASFWYEIFPDGSCTVPTCATKPDFTFSTNLNSSVLHTVAPTVSTLADKYSPASGGGTAEQAPQLPPTFYTSGALNGATALTFADWPATIGIDDLSITFHTPTVPEPGTMLLVGTGALALIRRRKTARAQA